MLMRRPRAPAGFTIIELMLVVAVIGVALMVGLPSISVWIQNTQVKTSAEALVSGLQLARAEALKRNVNVRFQLVDVLTNDCVLAPDGRHWVVSLTDPATLCATAPNVVPPEIVQTKSGDEGSPKAALLTPDAATTAVFNGLGRLTGAGNLTQIDISNPSAGLCQKDGGPVRCLRVLIAAGGAVRMCDPAVSAADDPRLCP